MSAALRMARSISRALAPRHHVYADPDFIHQVVYNIVDNAIKFTPPDGVIKFDIQQENDMVRVTIENTGDGIAPDALPLCLNAFIRRTAPAA